MRKSYGSLPLWLWTLLPSFYAFCIAVIVLMLFLPEKSIPSWFFQSVKTLFFTAASGIVALPICGAIRRFVLGIEYLSTQGYAIHKQIYFFGIVTYIIGLIIAFGRIVTIIDDALQ